MTIEQARAIIAQAKISLTSVDTNKLKQAMLLVANAGMQAPR